MLSPPSNWKRSCGRRDYNALMDRTPGTSRRQFLTGKPAGEGAADAPQEEATELSSETYLVQLSRRAMACEFVIYMNAGQYEAGPQAAMDALDLVERLEDQMTVFRAHSEVMNI